MDPAGGRIEGWETTRSTGTRARPKSMSLAWSSLPATSITFCGFTSRWMMPMACAAPSPAASCRAMRAARAAGTGPSLTSCCSVLPETYSSTRKYEPSSSWPKSVAAATLGWMTCAPAMASRSKRATSSGRFSVSGRSTLTATRFFRCRWCPR